MNQPFQTIQTSDPVLNRIQSYISAAFNAFVGPFIGGDLISNVSVGTSPTVINHQLNRQPQVWVICDQNTLTNVYRISWNSNSITLEAGADCVISLWLN